MIEQMRCSHWELGKKIQAPESGSNFFSEFPVATLHLFYQKRNMLKNVNTMLNFVVLCLFCRSEACKGGFSNLKFDSLRNIES